MHGHFVRRDDLIARARQRVWHLVGRPNTQCSTTARAHGSVYRTAVWASLVKLLDHGFAHGGAVAQNQPYHLQYSMNGLTVLRPTNPSPNFYEYSCTNTRIRQKHENARILVGARILARAHRPTQKPASPRPFNSSYAIKRTFLKPGFHLRSTALTHEKRALYTASIPSWDFWLPVRGAHTPLLSWLAFMHEN